MPAPADDGRASVRTRLRAWRRAVPAEHARRAAQAAARRALALPVLRAARHVALYVAGDGELDPAPLLSALVRKGTAVYLPVTPGVAAPLRFRRHRPGAALVPDARGMPVPATGALRPPGALDVVVVPLLAFDANGRRLGRGGGHYDRSFAPHRCGGRRPVLLGYAYEGQRVASLSPARWDVPLDAVVTPWRVWHRGRAFEVVPPAL